MKTLEKVSDFVGKYMAAIVIVVAAGALFFPGPFSVVKTAWVNNLLGIVMFGMAGACRSCLLGRTPSIQPESSERIFPRMPCTALHQPAALCSIPSGYSFSS